MTTDSLKEGLEGLSKIEGISDSLFTLIYWVAVIFIILFIAYIASSVNCYMNRKKRGSKRVDDDDFLDI